MIEHTIQKKILRRLVLGHDRFSQLQPADVDSNLYNYHLRQLIAGHYVEKTDAGFYRLTALGKAEGINSQLNNQQRLAQAHAIILLLVRDTTGRYLLRKRLVHPMYGRIGFLHGEPVADEPLSDTAAATLYRRLGLLADFSVIGSGFVRIFLDEAQESFTSFSLLAATIEPPLVTIAADESGQNFWTDSSQPDFTTADMLPSMAELVTASLNSPDHHFFADLTYHL